MPQFEHIEKIGKLKLLLANRKIIDECPTGVISSWSALMIDEFLFAKEFGLSDDISEAQFQSFKIIIAERNEIEEIKRKKK